MLGGPKPACMECLLYTALSQRLHGIKQFHPHSSTRAVSGATLQVEVLRPQEVKLPAQQLVSSGVTIQTQAVRLQLPPDPCSTPVSSMRSESGAWFFPTSHETVHST